MKEKREPIKKYRLFHIFVSLLSCVILLGVGIFTYHLYLQLVDESKTIAWELTEKAADALQLRLEDIRTDLSGFAEELSVGEKTPEDINQIVSYLTREKTFFRIHVVASDGRMLTPEYDMTEEYKEMLFSLCEDDFVFSKSFIGKSGRWQTAIASMVTVNGETCRIYAESILDDLYLDRFMEFYDGQGYCYVISRESGEFLMLPQNRFGQGLYSGLFTMLQGYEGNNPDVIDKVQDALKFNQACTVQLEFRGEESYFCFVPITQQEDWFVVSVIPAKVLQSNGMNAIGAVILLGAALLIGTCCILVLDRRRWRLHYEMQAIKIADDAKTSFLSNMSHEIRTPMNAIIGLTEIMKRKISEPEQMEMCIEKMQTSSLFLLDIINDVLDMSKIESGKMSLENGDFLIGPLLDSVLDLILPLARQHGHDFEVCVYWESPECLIGDAKRLSQVLVNLLSNAVKYTPDNGKIRLRVYGRANEESSKYTDLRIEVEDNGIGMSQEYQQLIFEPFSQEKNSLSRGTGLGMAIASQMVNLMGGRITLHSELNEGSLFCVYLSLPSHPQEAYSRRGLKEIQVLAIEPEPEVNKSIVQTLTYFGIGIRCIDSPEDARKLLENGKKTNMLLLNKGFGMESMQLAEAASAFGVDIYLTGYGLDNLEEDIEIPIKGKLNKPILPSKLIQLLKPKEVLDNSVTEELSLKGIHILLAEDNELNAEIAIELLSYYGAYVVRGRNGLEAVQLFSESEPGEFDVILMDIQMPEMNGYEAVRRIRSQNRPEAATIPILAMTADVFSDDIEHSKEAGMNGHIAKPIDIQKLMKEIQRAMGRKGKDEKA